MKKIILITLIFFFTLNKNTIRKQDLHNVIKGYIEFISKKRKVDNNKEILAVVVHAQKENNEQQYAVDVAFFKPEFMEDIEYKNVYIFEGYKLILPDNECKAIEKMFTKIKYENFNQSFKNFINNRI